MTKESKSKRAGLKFPVTRILQRLRKGPNGGRSGDSAGVVLSAFLQGITTELKDDCAAESLEHVNRKTGRFRITQHDAERVLQGHRVIRSIVKSAPVPLPFGGKIFKVKGRVKVNKKGKPALRKSAPAVSAEASE